MISNIYVCNVILFTVLLQMFLIKDSLGFTKGLANCSCGQETDPRDIGGRVLGGTVLRRLSHPSLAMVVYLDNLQCGGSVVGPRHVLTAGHCLEEVYSLYALKVVLGAHDRITLDPHAKTYDVNKMIRHEKYDILKGNIVVNDIALLEVDEIKFNAYVKPICLPFNLDESRFKAAAVMGWGNTQYRGVTSNKPRGTLLSILTTAQCKKSELNKPLSKVSDMFKMILCAYGEQKDACQGDSGGPLYVLGDNDIRYQIGIVSFGFQCGTFGIPGLYTRVSHYLDWLDKHMSGQHCAVPSSR